MRSYEDEAQCDIYLSPSPLLKHYPEQISNCRLVVYPKLGHGINVIYPKWCTQQVREFLGVMAGV